MSNRITDPSRLAELREMNNYRGQHDRCDACGSTLRLPSTRCCIVCGKPYDSLRSEIEQAINKYSAENGSNTPDFILAEYLTDCLAAYDKAVTAREKWLGPPYPERPSGVQAAAGGTVKVVPPRSPLSPGSVVG